MSEITLGLMNIGDVDAVEQIEKLSFHTPWSRESILREVNDNKFAVYMVVREDGVTIAYAGMWVVIDEGHVTNVAVHPDKRGQGYGEMVMRALIQLAADCGVGCMELEVRRTNDVAKNLYKKLGFIKVGIRKNYYENNEDAILMALVELPEGNPDNDPFLVKE